MTPKKEYAVCVAHSLPLHVKKKKKSNQALFQASEPITVNTCVQIASVCD